MFSQQNGAYFYPVNLRVGDPPIYYDVTTSASYTGGITLCLSYSKVHFNLEFDLKLYHYENGAWTDITTSLDTANDIVCGVTTSLSPFAIFGAPLPPMEVVGLAPPLAPLVLEGNNASLPAKAFKLGKTLPLKFQLLVRSVPMTAQEVKAPTIAQLSRVGEPPLNLDTLDLDAGQANDSGYAFRSSDGQWVYNLSTKGLSVGTYSVTIQMPDGRRYVAGFALSK